MSFQELLTRSTATDDGDSHRETGVNRLLHRYERSLWTVVIVAMSLDVLLTVYGRSLGLHEQNPIARRALHVAGASGLVGLKLVALTVGVCCLWLVPRRYRTVVPVGLAVPSLVAVGINAAFITWIHL